MDEDDKRLLKSILGILAKDRVTTLQAISDAGDLMQLFQAEKARLQKDLDTALEANRDMKGTLTKIMNLEMGYIFQGPLLAKDRLEMMEGDQA